jgi:hypothetical protein
MSCNCNDQKPNDDEVREISDGSLRKELIKELKPFRLVLNKNYFFKGNILFNGKRLYTRASLILNSDDHRNTYYLLQFKLFQSDNQIFKPFTDICLLDNRGITSNQNGFYISYQIIDQSLQFYSMNSNDFLFKGILEDSILKNNTRSTGGNPGTINCGAKPSVGQSIGSCGYCNCGTCLLVTVYNYGYLSTCGECVNDGCSNCKLLT